MVINPKSKGVYKHLQGFPIKASMTILLTATFDHGTSRQIECTLLLPKWVPPMDANPKLQTTTGIQPE